MLKSNIFSGEGIGPSLSLGYGSEIKRAALEPPVLFRCIRVNPFISSGASIRSLTRASFIACPVHPPSRNVPTAASFGVKLVRYSETNQSLSFRLAPPAGPLSDSYRAICSSSDNLRRQQASLVRQSRQRSSEHHWQQMQSGQGCFFVSSWVTGDQ